ncbi:MAG TPA: bifunctional DNA-formamidopyrimidine glycosylase/DNA-(apurinic or apyrimidinic site) lyase [Methylococcales bacterium]|nr:bifunctional DNA-formamidopyrimidine glycosylase/DNA-(apurinic or apyrimidinic site) lyase [Methylococcales bacterium]
MPELPEVETTRRGIEPYLTGIEVTDITIRQKQLRWPISDDLSTAFKNQTIQSVQRKAKYLLLNSQAGTTIIHLGMSGNLQIVRPETPLKKHDHVDFHLANDFYLRFNDPRRFGCILWTNQAPEKHKLLNNLGPEPFADNFTGHYLYLLARNSKRPIKSFIMDPHIVVGVGNIYANEALFAAGIHPTRPAGRISLARYLTLNSAIKTILSRAIEQGGTTLKDFVGGSGKAGYFKQELNVYGRNNQPCIQCGQTLILIRQSNRATVFCSHCQH